jgi:hypothetical protein
VGDADLGRGRVGRSLGGDEDLPGALEGRARRDLAFVELALAVVVDPRLGQLAIGGDEVGLGGFPDVTVRPTRAEVMIPTRLDPRAPEVLWAAASIRATLGKPATILPNLGGGLPNHVFAEDLGLPTIWIPHSYPGCRQHAPDEHNLLPVLEEGLALMTGLLWDFGSGAFTRRAGLSASSKYWNR